jgi:hypothetical protein
MLVDDLQFILAHRGQPRLDVPALRQNPNFAAALDRLTDAAHQVAPELRLHRDDEYLPSSVEFFLGRVELGIWDRPSGSWDRVIPQVAVGAITTGSLLSQVHLDQRSGSEVLGVRRRTDWRLYILRARRPANIDRDSWKPFCEATRRGSPGPANFYVHIRRPADESDAIDLQYWFFYPYNGVMGSFPFTAEHEGDWEHATVRVDGAGTPRKVYFSAHDGEGSWYRVGPDSSVTLVGGSHPVVYSARHSHASYPIAGTIGRHGSSINLPDDVTSDDGLHIDTATQLRLIALEDAVFLGEEWVHFTGAWGRSASPYGPAFQASWIAEADRRRT